MLVIPGRGARSSDNELRVNDLMRLAWNLPMNKCNQGFPNTAPMFNIGFSHRRQGWVGKSCQPDVVKSNYRKLLRYAQPVFTDGAHCAECHYIIHAKYSSGQRGHLE